MFHLTLPKQLDSALARLKGGIRRYVLLRGIAIVLTVLVGLFWLSLAIDTVWFSLTRLELPRSTRLGIVIGGLAVLVAVLYQSLIWQLLVQLRRRALALVLERQFPQLNDRLITMVEAAEQRPASSASATDGAAERSALPSLSQTMLDRTLAETCRIVESLQIEQVFNPRPLQRAIVLASIALVSVAATAAASPATFTHWSKAYVELAVDYWNRVNGLDVFVLAQPGDRLRPFENRLVKHAAGTDLTILVETREGKQTPDQAVLTYRTASGARVKAPMTPAGDGKFRHTIGNLVENIEFFVTGGDFTTVEPFRVQTVPEPQIEGLTALCDYPEYTGWNSDAVGEPRERKISSSVITVPMETRLELLAASSKPLIAARVSGRNFELVLRRPAGESPTAQYRRLDERGVVQYQSSLTATGSELISADGRTLRIPVLVTSAQESIEGNDREIVIAQADQLRITLEDQDGIMNLEPSRLQITGQPDEPPVVQTRLSGIGRAITRKANLPFIGTIRDDYGLQKLYFEYRLNDEQESEVLPTRRKPGGEREFVMEQGSSTPVERFDVLPLELKINDQILITIAAEDTDDINGPGLSRGERYRLKIVSDEDLLSLLYQDELNLRRRFEQVIEEITRARDDLQQVAGTPAEGTAGTAGVAESIQRALNMIQKDVVETDAIRAAFASIHEELVNNRIDTPQVRARLVDQIINPLGRVISQEFAVTEEHLRQLDFSLRQNQPSEFTAATCLADLDRLLEQLARILLEMRKLESFQEVIELLKGIIDEEKALKEKTESERKKKLIDLLN